MTHACCLRCSARFTREAAAVLVDCPLCGDPLDDVAAHHALGRKLLGATPAVDEPPPAVAAAAVLVRLRHSGDAHA